MTQKNVFKTNKLLMQVKSIPPVEHSAILSTYTKLPPVLKTFVIPPANFVCGGYTVFTLSVRPCVRNVLFP